MKPEEIGKLSVRLRVAFTVVCVVFVAVLAISPVKDQFREWKGYENDYEALAHSRPDTKTLLADYHSGIDQIWLPELGVTDRCTTCHQGLTQTSLLDPSVPQPFRAHPSIPHSAKEWGCTVCHRGQGAATEVAEAHETTLAWEQPVLSTRYLQASCGSCHRGDIAETPRLNRGRELLANLNCAGCHNLEGIKRSTMLGPDLDSIGSKVGREWIYKWLKEPHTELDSQGNTAVNGYQMQNKPRMPVFQLSDTEMLDISAYLSGLQNHPLDPYTVNPSVVASLASKPDIVEQGEARFREMFCTTCHSLAVTRGEETTLIGGDIGPELTKVGSKVKADWLISWLRNPQGYLPHATMPRYQWTDEDLYKVTQYINAKLTDPDLLSNVPQLEAPTAEQIQNGQRLFADKGCASCHAVQGISPQKDFGPDLSALGAKNVSELDFGGAAIPRNTIAYIRAKISDPASVNRAARMPRYRLAPDDLDAITTALLAMKGDRFSSGGFRRLIVPKAEPSFRPTGSFGEVYQRYRCDACHRFNGVGGTLAPDLSNEGSRAQRQWMIDFLKNPQTLRPTLTFRMPQFNMTDQEAATIADYLGMVDQSPDIQARTGQSQFSSQLAEEGKQLYEVKYQCASCHTIGSTGGYVGPNLNNAGNWLKPEWIEGWLKNPQALVPGTIEPRRSFTSHETEALTAYLMGLRAGGTAKLQSRSIGSAGSTARGVR